jgi:lysophospholipase L1-like esterase
VLQRPKSLLTAIALLGAFAAPAVSPTPARAAAPATVDTAAPAPGAHTRSTGPLLKKLNSRKSASLLVIGDSTGNGYDEWVYLLTKVLAKRYPDHTVRHMMWNPYDNRYRPSKLVTWAGGSAPTLTVYNASAGGKSTLYHLSVFTRMMPRNPDLVFLSHGHNEGAIGPGVPGPARWRSQYEALADRVRTAAPATEVTVVLQNPRIRAQADDADRRAVYRQIAVDRAYGLVDVHSMFVQNPRWTTQWMADNTHPNGKGEIAWTGKVGVFLPRRR